MRDQQKTPWFFISSCILFGISLLLYTFELFNSTNLYAFYMNLQNKKDNYSVSNLSLPSSYIVHSDYLLPAHDQGNRGTCWAFASIYLLESQYRAQGIRSGLLDDNEYLPFSVEAFVTLMSGLCNGNPNSIPCKNSPRARNTSSGGWAEDLIDFTLTFPSFKKSAVPFNVCVYHDKKTDQFKCDNLAKHVEHNPVEYQIKSFHFRTGIQGIKKLLFRAERPIAFSLPMPYHRYWFPCDNNLTKNSQVCKDKLFTRNGKNVGFHDFGVFKFSDTGLVHFPVPETVPGGGHAVSLVGYNDNFVVRKASDISGLPIIKGGYILRNSWGPRGHSYEYLMGQISDDQEALICPNEGDATRWIPVSSECIKNTKNITECGGDVLRCVNVTHCVVNKTYALVSDGSSKRPLIRNNTYGTPIARVVKVDGDSIEFLDIDSLPFTFIVYALNKVVAVNNTDPRCGYLFLSYKTLKQLQKHAGTAICEISGVDIELKFKKSSYPRAGKWRDYSDVLKSIRRFNKLKSSSPFESIPIEPSEPFFQRPPDV